MVEVCAKSVPRLMALWHVGWHLSDVPPGGRPVALVPNWPTKSLLRWRQLNILGHTFCTWGVQQVVKCCERYPDMEGWFKVSQDRWAIWIDGGSRSRINRAAPARAPTSRPPGMGAKGLQHAKNRRLQYLCSHACLMSKAVPVRLRYLSGTSPPLPAIVSETAARRIFLQPPAVVATSLRPPHSLSRFSPAPPGLLFPRRRIPAQWHM